MELITPRQFCRAYFRIDSLPEEKIQEIEKGHGYKTRCADAIARVLGMSRSTLINSRFSKGIEFEGFRNNHQALLFLTMWVIERRYPQTIQRLDSCVREISALPARRVEVA